METNKVVIATRMGECTSYPLVWGGAVSIYNMEHACSNGENNWRVLPSRGRSQR